MPNKLIHETSPYLLQHAHNPVDWYPWGEEALAQARSLNKPILVSIGYSACHWCHVMERESFEDPEAASIMNHYFINIKIDREERPDLDHIYMDAVQAITGSGGWPLNVFLTPDARPFYGGTYFPPVRAYNRSSWKEVLMAIHHAWTTKPDDIFQQAGQLVAHLTSAGQFSSGASEDTAFTAEALCMAAAALLTTADQEWGGFGHPPKFPQTMSITAMLRQQVYFSRYGKPADLSFDPERLLQHAELSLRKMMSGGMYDHLAGGFARYSTDREWLVPHFEKMLYDNALLVMAMSEAYQITGAADYARTIRQTIGFVEENWLSPEGGCYSALDADSEGAEGKYYTWTLQDIREALPNPEEADIFCRYYGVSEHGNWEETNILWVQKPLEMFCREQQLAPEPTATLLENCRRTLLEVRKNRESPLLDEKKIMGWNALMLEACCKAGAALGESRFIVLAEKIAAYTEQYLSDGRGGYFHHEKDGKTGCHAFLDDLAFYASALCHLQECTGNSRYLLRAAEVTEHVIEAFSDEEHLFFYFTPVGQQDVILRKKETYDGATPSGNSVMAKNLLYLGTVLNRSVWKERAAKMTSAVGKTAVRYPGSFAYWLMQLQVLVYGMHEIAVTGSRCRELTMALLAENIPNKVLQQAPVPDNAFPLLAFRDAGADTLIYSCYDFTCRQPVGSVSELLNNLPKK